MKGKAKEREKRKRKQRRRRYSVVMTHVIKGRYSAYATTFSFLIQERSSGEGEPTMLRI